MADLIIFDPFNRFVWTIAIVLLFINCILYIKQGILASERSSRFTLIGMGGLIGGLAFSRLLFFVSDYFRTGYYDGHSYIAASGGDPFWFNKLGTLATASFLLGMVVFFLFLGVGVNKRYIILLAINVVLITWLFNSSHALETIATYVSFGFDGITLILILVRFTTRSSKHLQLLSIFLFSAICIYMIGTVFDSGLIKDYQLISASVPGVFIIFSAIIAIISVTMRLTSVIKLKFAIGILTSILLASLAFAFVMSINVIINAIDNQILLVAIWIAMIMVIIVIFYTIYRLKYSIDVLKGKEIPTRFSDSKTLLSTFLLVDQGGKVAVLRETDIPLMQRIESWRWDKGEKEEFMEYMKSLPADQREKILKEMIDKNEN